jgi:hypothetical protein
MPNYCTYSGWWRSMLILYPKLPNGNILWSCDNCDGTAQVSCSDTHAVALLCMCDSRIHPRYNDDWYNKGLYWKRIPLSVRLKGTAFEDWNK